MNIDFIPAAVEPFLELFLVICFLLRLHLIEWRIKSIDDKTEVLRKEADEPSGT